MAYTSGAIYGGEVVVKKLIRVSTWLRMHTAPDRICLYNAKVLPTMAGAAARAASFTELHIATNTIQVFHILPPAHDPLDYDPSEPNRRMQPVIILAANVRIDGHLRLSTQTTVSRFLESARETFTAVYDAKITNPQAPAMTVLQVSYVIVRQETSVFATP
jgi:hypothetical protein